MKSLDHILIFGMGLMGGSLSLAIKKKYPDVKVTGIVRSEKSKIEIIESRIADEAILESDFLLKANWGDYDFIIFATPVQTVVNYIPKLKNFKDLYITDLGSTKKSIIDEVNLQFNEDHNYISSHPMCGSEFSGPSAAKHDLYENKLCIVTRAEKSSLEASDFVRNFWDKIGSWTMEMDASEHDEILSYLSHLPHIISTILVETAIQNKTVKKIVSASEKAITGGGFRDMSRIAGSNYEMWESIFTANKSFIHRSLIEFKTQIEQIINEFDPKKEIDREKLHQLWNDALKAKEIIQKTK
ncbi:MAG: prephenate dehydrogenase/arogenate dehydrogenase family protein [Leptospira sp.]|nr:prephenate dehydrogenase/arogenate dehydrogenase family protein [Leptospira sp.]